MTRRTRSLAALAVAAMPLAAVAGSASAADPSALLPDDLAFLESPVIDEVIAGAEGGRAECAALSSVMGIAFASALVSADWDFGATPDTEVTATTEPVPNAAAFWAVASPMLVPLLDRATTDDPAAAAFVEVAGPDLVDAVYELRDLGLTDDDLLLIQQSFAYETLASSGSADSAGTEPGPDDSAALAELEQRAAALVSHDFESITFLDPEAAEEMPGMGSDSLPWAAECPETAGMFDFDMDPVSATMDFEVTVTAP